MSGQCACPAQPTTLTGTVLNPAGTHPVYRALVYVPGAPDSPGLQPFPEGVRCEPPGTVPPGSPLAQARTAADGTFTLQNVPTGTAVPLVVQVGPWRRQFTVDIRNACGANAVSMGTLRLPANQQEGDLPRIGVLTGGWDLVECTLRKMGISDSEFTNPDGTGRVHFYLRSEASRPANPFGPYAGQCPPNPYGHGARINAATPSQAALFGPAISRYDALLLAAGGYEENMQADWAALGAYAAAGGRVMTGGFGYEWLARTRSCTGTPQCGTGGVCSSGVCMNANNVTENPAFAGMVAWHTLQNPGGSSRTVSVDVTNPRSADFIQWLEGVEASAPGSGTLLLKSVFRDVDGVLGPTQQWLADGSLPAHLVFNTPTTAAPQSQCGRVGYAGYYAPGGAGFAGSFPSCPYNLPNQAPYYSRDLTFPAECDATPMTPNELVWEFMFMDLINQLEP